MDLASANQLLGFLAKKVGAEGITLDESTHYCALIFGASLLVNFQLSPEGLSVCCCVGVLPPTIRRERLLMEMMQANCLNAETKGATLGLEPTKKVVVLHKNFILPQDENAFWGRFVSFMEVAQHWADRLKGLEALFPANRRLRKRGIEGEKTND